MVKEGYRKTEIGVIPEDWDIVPLLDKAELLNGLTYTPNNIQEYGLLVMRSSNVQNGRFVFDDNVYVDCEVDENKLIKLGDILICVRNGSAALIGKCAKADRDYNATFGAFMAVLRGDDNEYIIHLLRQGAIQRHIAKNSDSTINQITNGDFRQIVIPFPKRKSERETIAAALSDIDALIDNLEKLIAKKKAIKQACLQDMFPKPSETVPKIEEGFSIQRGMNFNVANRDYGIILMSVRPNAPYADRFEDDGTTIIYEGHDVQSNYAPAGADPKDIDQPMTLPSGILTENGKFFEAARTYETGGQAKIIKVYEKIKAGIWSYNGYFCLTDAWQEQSGGRNVFKFRLEMIDEVEEYDYTPNAPTILEQEHNRLIPTSVKVEVWQRDKGQCVYCGSKTNLHYDHIIPFSKGGSSTTAANIQLLCATCNLRKHDNIE